MSKLWLFAIALLLVSGVTTYAKDCTTTVSRGKELKQLVQRSHVLVALLVDDDDDADDADPSSTAKDANYAELCERLKATPEARVSDFEIVLVTDPILQRKVWSSSRAAPVTFVERAWFRLESYYLVYLKPLLPALPAASKKDEPSSTTPSLPEYVLFRQGASYETGTGLRYAKEDTSSTTSPTADAVSTFVASWLQRQKLGNYVYSLGTYDLIAAKTMEWAAAEANTKEKVAATVWVHVVGRLAKYLVQPTFLDFETELASIYFKCSTKVLEHGVDYPQTQIDRLERLLAEEDSSISPLQREKLSQRLYIWKRFQEPITVSSDALWNFMGRLALNLLSVLGMAILVPLILFARDDSDDEEAETETAKEEIEGEVQLQEQPGTESTEENREEGEELSSPSPNVAKKLFLSEESPKEDPSSSAPKELTKKEKTELAIRRAKESMAADKKRVEDIKAKKSGAAAASSSNATGAPAFTENELQDFTVIQLKDMLKERNLVKTGKKADLIERLLSAGK